MRIHHLSCGTMCPWGGNLMFGPETDPKLRRLVCHCLLIETERHGLVLVDTGLGMGDMRRARQRLSKFFLLANRIQLNDEDTALHQLQARGFKASDVRHIVLTHLDFDHAGGIEDFPQATVHVLGLELNAARNARKGFVARNRYRPLQWNDGVHWQEHSVQGEAWMGFECVHDLAGLPPEILMVPLAGHTWGHCGIAIQRGDRWMLHAGDAYFYRGEMNLSHPHCPPGLRAYQRMMEVDRAARLNNQERLRNLIRRHGDSVEVFCAHDPAEFAARERSSRRAAD
jgi:glyoxylase-like metal-dependent hydrolase (beta-lactamase superfamily II)